MFIDAHCHLTDSRLAPELPKHLAEARAVGVGHWVQGGIDPNEWRAQSLLSETHPGEISCVFGVHPWQIAGRDEAWLRSSLDALAACLPNAAALGETGLDFAGSRGIDPVSRKLQEAAFHEQLDLAAEHDKPVVLHVVHAHDQTLAALRSRARQGLRGIVHSFSGELAIAKSYLGLGFVPSLGGAMTRPQKAGLRELLVTALPSDGFVIETDAPDQALTLESGTRASMGLPAHLIDIAKTFALGTSYSGTELLSRSSKTVAGIFGIHYEATS